jgi:hypothetical protein
MGHIVALPDGRLASGSADHENADVFGVAFERCLKVTTPPLS